MSKKNFEQTVILTLGKSVGLVLAFAIPMYLSRSLSVELYGTYKQVFLIYWFAMAVLNLGMDSSLFYFIKHHPRKLPLFSLNALLFNTIISSIVLISFLIFGSEIASIFKNPLLSQYLPALGVIIVLGISSQHLDDVFLAQEKIKYRVLLDILKEFLKSIIIIGAFYFFNSLHYALYGLAILLGLHYLFLLIYNLRLLKERELSIMEMFDYFMKQVRYGLPMGLARVLIFIIDMEKMLISSLFGVNTFTYYTVGCFENPIIPTVRSNAHDLMNIEMVESMKNKDYKKLQYLWQSITRKLFLIQIPLAIYMILFAEILISFIYSEKYIESSQYFKVFNLIILLGAFSPEIVFLVFAKTKQNLKIQVVSFLYTLGFILLGASIGGPLYALWGKFIGNLLTLILKLRIAKGLLKLNLTQLFLWRQLFIVSIISYISAFVLHAFIQNFQINNFLKLAITFSLFTLCIFIISIFTKVISDDEIQYLKDKVLKRVFK